MVVIPIIFENSAEGHTLLESILPTPTCVKERHRQLKQRVLGSLENRVLCFFPGMTD